MEKLLTEEKNTQSVSSNKTNLSIEKIEEFYLNKKDKTMRFGLEYERLSLDKNTFKNASYDKVSKIIEQFATIQKWELVYDNKTIIGAFSKDNASISLEPGCQLEISLPPKENIVDIESELSKITNLLDKIAQLYDVVFLGYGISPKSAVDEIELLNKERYQLMDNYLPYCKKGELCPKMMRQTAGMQINIDYKDNKDAYLKLEFFNLIMPFVTGLMANSPIDSNHLTQYKTARAQVWFYTGASRCNLFYKNIFNKIFFKCSNVFKNYINEVLDVPMLYIVREGINIPIKGETTFRDFIKHGYKNHSATMDDYILHQSLCFPDIRLKNYIEIRNHDSADFKTALALCAFYKGLCHLDFSDLLKKFEFLKLDKIEQYYKYAAQHGLDFKVDESIQGWDIVKELLELSKSALSTKERMYLSPIAEMVKERKTKADIIIDYGYKNAQDLISYLYE